MGAVLTGLIPQVMPKSFGVFIPNCRAFYPQGRLQLSGIQGALGAPPETGERPKALTSWTAHYPPLAVTLGGTLVEPTGRAAAAHAHLEIIRGRLASTGVPGDELIRYVVLAYIYGLEVDEIARVLNSNVEFVRWMLLVGA